MIARTMAALLCALAVSLAMPGRAVLAQQDACRGEDLIETFQREQPDRYRRIVDHFATIENSGSIFWKVEKPGLPPSYLFGTAHLADPRVLDLLPLIGPDLKNSRVLLVELAVLEPTTTGSIDIVRKYGTLPDGETLDSRLTEEERRLLGAVTASHGMPWFSARRMKPGFLAIVLGVPPCAKIPMMRGEKVLDARLIETAHETGIPVIGLETVETQLSRVSELDQDSMLAGLVEAARAGRKFAVDMFETTIRAHRTGKIAMMLSLSHELRKDYPANSASMESIKTILLDDRNIGMHQRALPEMERGGVFLAVGALHLPGSNGLVKLFQNSGFTLTPLELRQ